MAAIVKKPDVLSLSGNMKPFVVFVGVGSISFTLLKNGVDVIVQQSYECGTDGNVTIDVRDVIENSLVLTIDTENKDYEQTTFAQFKAIIGDLSHEFTVVRAGVANLADTATNFLRQHFLTWQPRVKEVTYYTPEWLTYYAVSASSLRLKATFADKSTSELSLCTIPAGTARTVNVQYAVVSGLLGHKYPTHYEIWAVSGGVKVSETLYYAYSEVVSDNEQWFLFENSLGGLDSFRAFGVSSLNAEHEHQMAEVDDERKEYRVDTERKYTKNTGHLDDYHRRWLLDFFPSPVKYIYESSAIRKVVVTEDTASYKSSDLPSSYTFTFQYVSVFPYLNLQRNEDDIPSEIVVPDLQAPDFILPPRLAEYQKVQLSEGVIIPAFEPHSETPTVTTFGAIHEGIYNSVTDYIEQVTEEIGKTLEEIKKGGLNPGSGGGTGENFPHLTSVDMLPAPSDENAFTALRTLVEIRRNVNDLDGRFLRKDVDDTAFGNITFQQSIHSPGFLLESKGWKINETGDSFFNSTFVRNNLYSDSLANSFAHENGFKIWADGGAWFKDLFIKKDAMFQGNLSSPFFVSGFPAGTGWALTWRDVVNAAGVAAKKAHFETDDITVRGILRVYEMVISQLLGVNGTHLTTDMMKIKSVDTEKKIIYLDTEEGALYNPFWTNDILMVQRFNGMPTPENGYYVTRQYEFVVQETHIGSTDADGNRVDWIKYKNFVGDEVHITERDTLVRVDNLTNSDRKGLIKQTSVEPNSPYMDIIYAMKTDPENAVRTRYGRLEGLITPYWGQLEGYGIMCDNLYAKGRFMLHTGEDVQTKFEVMEGLFTSTIESVRDDFIGSKGFLQNSSFSAGLYAWETDNSAKFYQVGNKWLWVNNSPLVHKSNYAAVVNRDNRTLLFISNKYVLQRHENFRSIPEFVDKNELGEKLPEAVYLSFFYKCKTPGTLKIEFLNTNKTGFEDFEMFNCEKQIEASDEHSFFTYSGLWNGTGDFRISFTGEIYINLLILTYDPAEALTYKYKSFFEQSSKLIRIAVGNFDINGNVLEMSSIVTTAKYNRLISEKFDANGKLINTSGLITTAEGSSLFASKSLENGNNIISYINVAPGTIAISSSKLNLQGAVTFTSFSQSLQNTINGKVNSSSLGSLAYVDAVEAAKLGSTIIVGGYLNTDYIKVKRIDADGARVGGFTIESGSLWWKGYDYFGNDSRSVRIGVPVLPSDPDEDNEDLRGKFGMVDVRFNAATRGRFGVKVIGSNLGGACIYASRTGNSYPKTGMTYAGFFEGEVDVVNGGIASDVCASQEFRAITSRNANGTYTYQKGISFDSGYDLDDVRLTVVNGLIVALHRDNGSIIIGQ